MSKTSKEMIDEQELTQIKSNPTDILGISYSGHRGKMSKMALVNPSGYFDLRTKVLTLLTEQLVLDVYEKTYALLRNGKIGTETVIDYPPSYPSNKTNELALSISASMNTYLQQVVDIVVPQDFIKLSTQKLIDQQNAI